MMPWRIVRTVARRDAAFQNKDLWKIRAESKGWFGSGSLMRGSPCAVAEAIVAVGSANKGRKGFT